MSILSIILVYAFGACLSHAHPFVQQSSYSESSSSRQSLSSANGITVTTSQHSDDSGCHTTLEIKGRGIYKTVETICETEPILVINLKDSLLVGDYFSDRPGVLIHITDEGLCESETFESRGRSHLETLAEDECEKIKEKVEVLREQEKKWEEWHKEQLELAKQQLRNLDRNLFNLRMNLFPRRGWTWGDNW